MSQSKAAINRETLRRLFVVICDFLKSPVGRKARLLLLALFGLIIGINAMNVANSFVGRDFMSSIESRNSDAFVRYAWLYVGVFALSTLTGVFFRFTEERLGLLWREWLTRHISDTYIRLKLYQEIEGQESLSNADQRITEDVRQLTTTTLSFVLMILNATLTVISFSGVLWAISSKLFIIAVLYALIGSGIAIWLGRPLIQLNYRQADYEANFRTELIQTHEESEKILTLVEEQDVRARLNSHIDRLALNLRHIISINRNLNFFTSGYNYLIQLIPVLIVAPLFIDGKTEFGVIGQASMAFAALLGAFSLIITQFQAISTYAAVISRLGELAEHASLRDKLNKQSSFHH
jgi:vitamin B12/bleomycin/antimicrobial peptide transport system ATP-binding/permease protein